MVFGFVKTVLKVNAFLIFKFLCYSCSSLSLSLSCARLPNFSPSSQILGLLNFASADSGLSAADVGLAGAATQAPMMLQLNSADANAHLAGASFHAPVYQLGLSLEQGKGRFMKPDEASASGKRFRDDVVDNRAKHVRPPPFFDSPPLFGCALLQLFREELLYG